MRTTLPPEVQAQRNADADSELVDAFNAAFDGAAWLSSVDSMEHGVDCYITVEGVEKRITLAREFADVDVCNLINLHISKLITAKARFHAIRREQRAERMKLQ